jgi:hypothetical protein
MMGSILLSILRVVATQTIGIQTQIKHVQRQTNGLKTSSLSKGVLGRINRVEAVCLGVSSNDCATATVEEIDVSQRSWRIGACSGYDR